MATTSGRESARIYLFPTKAATTMRGQRQGGKFEADLAASRVRGVEFGSGWYHEAALQQDAERSRKP